MKKATPRKRKIGRPALDEGSVKEDLLAAAHRCLATSGEFPPSSKIAIEAGATPAVVNYYFGDREALFGELLGRILKPHLEELKTLRETEMTSTEKLIELVRQIIELRWKSPFVDRLANRVVSNSSKGEISRLNNTLLAPVTKAYLSILEDGQKSGEFRKMDPLMTMFSISGACDRFVSSKRFVFEDSFRAYRFGDKAKEAFIEHTVSFVLKGITTDPQA